MPLYFNPSTHCDKIRTKLSDEEVDTYTGEAGVYESKEAALAANVNGMLRYRENGIVFKALSIPKSAYLPLYKESAFDLGNTWGAAYFLTGVSAARFANTCGCIHGDVKYEPDLGVYSLQFKFSDNPDCTKEVINEFRGPYYFLSNFFEAPVYYHGLRFRNNEAAFQAMKCPERASEFCNLPPNRAKQLGRRVNLRPDWEQVKFDIMYDICRAKFIQNPHLCTQLLKTDDAILVEGNTWNDRIWGVCKGVGENHLGKILMRLRGELRTF